MGMGSRMDRTGGKFAPRSGRGRTGATLFVALMTLCLCMSWCAVAPAMRPSDGQSASPRKSFVHKHHRKHAQKKQRKRVQRKKRRSARSLAADTLSAKLAALSVGKIEPYSKDPSETRPYYACPPPTETRASCNLIVNPNPPLQSSGGQEPVGYSPEALQSAYGPDTSKSATVAVIVANGHPYAHNALKVYRSHYGLPPCEPGSCFKRVNQYGEEGNYPPQFEEDGWGAETSLDLDMVSAMCPKCKLILVEVKASEDEDLGIAVNAAVALGADVVSLSWVGSEDANVTKYNHYYEHPGVAIVAASGDKVDPTYPASSPDVIAAGGTLLIPDESPRGWMEYVWHGAGSGCTKYQPKPSWQTDTGCDYRSAADVSAIANPALPVSVYNSEPGFFNLSGWIALGGTSASAPIIAGIEATKSKAFREAGAKAFKDAAANHELYDVVSFWNKYCVPKLDQGHYLCEGSAGYDGPSGWGTPGEPLPGPPASPEIATLIEPEEATLGGYISPQGKATTFVFEYGTTTAYGSTVPASPASAGSGTETVRVTQKATGLKPSTEYHFRISATNSTGTYKSEDLTFTTPATPKLVVATELPTGVQVGGATLNGKINPAGSEATYEFEYGLTDKYGSSVPVPASATGTKFVSVGEKMSGLRNGKTYHYRLKATNGSGTVYGIDRFFTTPDGQPVVTAVGVTKIEGDQAELTGTIAPGGESTSYHFEYGPTEAYGKVAPSWGSEEIGSGIEDVDVAQKTHIVKPNTTYHFRLVAENAKGTVASPDQTFTTREWGAPEARYPADMEFYQPAKLTETSCTSPSACFVVGYYTNTSKTIRTLANQRNESGKWQVQTTPNPSGAKESRLEGVSCTSSTACTAVGNYVDSTGTRLTLAERWNGTEWTIQSTPNPSGAKESRLESVSCTSSTACTATGYYVNSSGTTVNLAERWNGSEWTIQSTPNPAGAAKAILHDVSCVSASDCWAVGESQEAGKEPTSLLERWNGSTWTIQTLPEPTKSLSSISCPATTWCMAVGDGVYVERWNGSAWSRQSAVSPGESPRLKAIHCRSQSACTAVGEYSHEGTAPLAEHWDGSGWSVQSTTDPLEGPSTQGASLEGVSCQSANGCSAVGDYFQEGRDTTLALIETHLATPYLTTELATGVSQSEAILNGAVDPNGDASTYQFEFGPTTSYGTTVPIPAKEAGSGINPVKVSQAISGLEASKTYHYRVTAQNSFGLAQGEDETFTTLPPCQGAEAKCEWKTQSTPDLTTSKHQLSGVSCASATMCFAVGRDALADKGLGELWNGSEWSVQVKASSLSGSPSSVSCPSTTWCMAAGNTEGGIPKAWLLKEEGGKWTPTYQMPPTPSGGSKGVLRSVSCTSTTACTAVGSYYVESESKYKLLVERWNGSSWSTQTAAALSESSSIEEVGVSCPTSTSCIMVGTHLKGSTPTPFAQSWNGTSWSALTPQSPGSYSTKLRSVSCTSSTSCIAVGSYKETKTQPEKPLAESWNGSAWSTLSVPSPETTQAVGLKGISCTSTSACTAAGYYWLEGKQRTLAESWNGTNWTIQASPNPSPELNSLNQVSCTAVGACTAVGSMQPEAGMVGEETASLAERWNGSEWKTQVTPSLATSEYSLSGVSCASATMCFAVGSYPLIERGLGQLWNGSTWTTQVKAVASINGYPSSVSCPSTTWCMVAGSGVGGLPKAWLLKEEGGEWTRSLQTPPLPSGGSNGGLRSVSCTSTSACTAVGYYYDEGQGKNRPLVEHWNGSKWTAESAPSPVEGSAATAMMSVSCASGTSCVAVGEASNAPFAERWDGTSWSVMTTPLPAGAIESGFENVSCGSPSGCMAVGTYKESGKGQYPKPLAQRWNGSEWSIVSVPSPAEAKGEVRLEGISCVSPSYCTAVGQYSPTASANPEELKTLTEYWDGAKWVVQASPNSSLKVNGLNQVSCSSAIACTAVGGARPELVPTLGEAALAARYE